MEINHITQKKRMKNLTFLEDPENENAEKKFLIDQLKKFTEK